MIASSAFHPYFLVHKHLYKFRDLSDMAQATSPLIYPLFAAFEQYSQQEPSHQLQKSVSGVLNHSNLSAFFELLLCSL